MVAWMLIATYHGRWVFPGVGFCVLVIVGFYFTWTVGTQHE